MIVRIAAIAVLAAVVGVGLFQGGEPSAEATVYRFLLDWEQGQYHGAAELTTGRPVAVANALAGAYRQLDASNLVLAMERINQQGSTASAQFTASIDLGSSGLVWTYQGSLRMRDAGSGWQVIWSPSVIVPGMAGVDRLAVVTSMPSRSQLLAAGGQPLTVPSDTYQVGVIPDQLADPAETAADLAAVTQLPAGQVEGQIEAARPTDFFELITLSPAEYDALRGKLTGIPGLRVRMVKERLFDSIAPEVVGTVGTEIAKTLRDNGLPYRPGATVGQSGLQQTFQHQLTGTATTQVVLENGEGHEIQVLHRWQGIPGKPVHTTLQANVQIAADDALAQLPTSAAIVAVQPTSGRILAVASHDPGGLPPLNPLAGRYQPGQAFTIISSAAILATGLGPDNLVPCPAINPVYGDSFVNVPPERNLGASPPFSKDFAYACSTAFAALSMRLTAADLTRAADEFGIGAAWQLPVSSYFAGSIGASNGSELAADAIGSGSVRVSPLAMALAAAVVDSGRWRDPSLVIGGADPSNVTTQVVSAHVLTGLQGLMRDAVAHGSGADADAGGHVYGQVGIAPYGIGSRKRVSWFVGYRGDVAFAVIELVGSPYDSAAPLAGTFLHDIQDGL
jgi:cell division protein FtsI/penicillin-binding protein 2